MLSRDALVQFMVDELGLEPDDAQDDTPLFSTGLLDSFSMVDLIGHIEKTAGIKIKATEVSLDHFDTIGRMLAFVEKRANG